MGGELNYSEWFFYDPEVCTGLRWKKDIYGGVKYKAIRKQKCSIAGGVVKRRDGKSGGCMVQIQGKRIYTHRIVWELFNGPIPSGMVIDHLNRNNCDNRIENLKCKTLAENNRNATMHERNKTGVTGVKYHPATNPVAIATTWYENGKQHTQYFRFSKYGQEEAMRLATELRKSKIAELNKNGANYTDTHGGV